MKLFSRSVGAANQLDECEQGQQKGLGAARCNRFLKRMPKMGSDELGQGVSRFYYRGSLLLCLRAYFLRSHLLAGAM